MRKLYALLAGFTLCLASITGANAKTVTPDVANFTFAINAPNTDVVFTNTSTIGSEPGERRALWLFGDGTSQWTGPLAGTQHHYQVAGAFNACLRIYRINPTSGDSVLTAETCRSITITTGSTCQADFTTIAAASNILARYFVAQPMHSQNKKPVRVCWQFGDGTDTCIQYSTTYTGTYGAYHVYGQPGVYNACVNILYDGGCQAYRCHEIQITRPDSCRADFVRLPATSVNNPLSVIFKALPWHNNGNKPTRICWQFGDGRDTCINYTNSYTGLYMVGHTYAGPGVYQVCVDILYTGGCEAHKCSPVEVIRPDTCSANYERIVSTSADPLRVYLKAIPGHNNNRKPSRVCWQFGDGQDTCINYPESFTGLYVVAHNYPHAGLYNVCVNILYYGGCEAHLCRPLQVGNPDSCSADFVRIQPSVTSLNAYFQALPWNSNNRKPSRICWNWGDNQDTCINYTEAFTGSYFAFHHYNTPGTYNVCVNILYFGGCEANKCKPVQIGNPDSCSANYERIISTSADPLRVYLKAIPGHNNNRKPSRVCWQFGDGQDTCINYPESFTGLYVVAHNYPHAGLYNVCVNILYYGGCEAHLCRPLQVGNPDSCSADFVRIQPSVTSLNAYFQALPWNSNNRKPSRICWHWGDNQDTCINYTEAFTGSYFAFHHYNTPGTYNVCVNILYFGGCEANRCKPIEIGVPDSCSANYERLPANTLDPLRVYLKAIPGNNHNRKPSRVCWQFGDGQDTCINYPETFTGLYVVAHNYPHPGLYNVCVNILYYGGCEAHLCRPLQVGNPDSCRADFERIQPNATSFNAYFQALPWHNNNRKPSRICWHWGDGSDTCFNYTETYTGQYIGWHHYNAPGIYNVCVNILYFGGCEANKCKPIQIGVPDSCSADFERLPGTSATSLTVNLKALPWNSNNRKPSRICWQFGDGRDTCINYSETFTGQYLVSHTYLQPGAYNVCINILYYGGCEAHRCRTIEVLPITTSCAVTLFEITPSITSLTRGFIAIPNSTPPHPVERVCWNFGDGHDTCIVFNPPSTASSFTTSHTYPGPGVYHACVTILYQGGCQAYSCREVVINGPSNICGGYMTDSVIGLRAYRFKAFSIHAPNDVVTGYHWTFGDGTSASGQDVTHTYTQGGNYNVCVVITTQSGCETRICKSINIPNNTLPILQLSPNPATAIINAYFMSSFTEPVTIRITNSLGTVVRTYSRSATTGPNTWSFDISALLPGIYSFTVQSPNQLASAIFLKQ